MPKNFKKSAESNLANLKEDISKKEEKLHDLEPEYTRLVEEESQMLTDIRISEQKCKELFAKQGYLEQFRTVEERDLYLKREIAFIDRQLAANKDQIREIEASIAADEEEISSLQTTLTVIFFFK